METPEKNQIPTPISKFEDSPIFKYISSLSPIKPVKSSHIAQSLNSLSLPSLQSVFTSPHISSHNDSRFLRRDQDSDTSISEYSSQQETKISTNEGVFINDAQLYKSAGQHENVDLVVSLGETSLELPGESKCATELPLTLTYNCGSHDYDQFPCSTERECLSELADASASQVPKVSEKGSSKSEVDLQCIGETDQEMEHTACDNWENLIFTADDILLLNSPSNTEAFKGPSHGPTDPGTRFDTHTLSRFPQNDTNNKNCTDDRSSQPGETCGLEEIEQIHNLASTTVNKCSESNLHEKLDFQNDFSMYRGIRRRCLDFEMVGALSKNTLNVSVCSSSVQLNGDEKIASDNKKLVPIKTGHDSSRCMLPAIGLHLNALATTSKDYKSLKHEVLPSKGQLIIFPCSQSNSDSPSEGQEPSHKSLALTYFERDIVNSENGNQLAEAASQLSSYPITEDCNLNNSERKRQRLEDAAESEGCKRCNCKKSKCLKLYCECFAAGVYCIEPCSCQDCFNKPIHEDTVLATRKQIETRNPLAFAPKVVRSSDSAPEIGDEPSETPASARHKRGCNCKKSSCLKKYCECYQGGVGCSINCRCEGCKNAFGRKDSSGAEPMEGEKCSKSVVDKVMKKKDERNSASPLPETPLQLSRSLVHLPSHSRSKPPQSAFPISSQIHGNLHVVGPESKFEFQTLPEEEIPVILGDHSPTSSMKTASPNSKRVSPPNSNFGPSPTRRRGRKLILQSIPSFPSLTPHQ